MHWILITTFMALTGQTIHAEIEITFSNTGLIKKGDELTITCSIDAFERFELLKLAHKIEDEEFDVAVNGEIQEPFKKHQRYSAIDGDENLLEGKQVVKIAGVLGDDRGLWLCIHVKVSNEQLKSASETIKVVVPPTNLVLSQMSHQGTYMEVANGETLVFSQGQSSGVKCVVTVEGTVKQPKVQIFLGEEDITQTFSVDELKLSQVEDGLYKENIEVTYSGYTEPKPEDGGKQLSCKAEMENHSETLSTAVTVEVHYPPQLSCSQSKMMSELESEVTLTCTADMKPQYESATWSWQQEGGDSVSLKPEGTSEDGNLRFMVLTTDSVTTFTLHVTEVGTEDFRVYTLNVENSQGSATEMVALEEAVAPETPTPGSKGSSTTTVTNEDQGKTKQVKDNAASSQQLSSVSLLVLLALALLL